MRFPPAEGPGWDPVLNPPSKGDLIKFKVVEFNAQTCLPGLSAFKVGRVLDLNDGNCTLQLASGSKDCAELSRLLQVHVLQR